MVKKKTILIVILLILAIILTAKFTNLFAVIVTREPTVNSIIGKYGLILPSNLMKSVESPHRNSNGVILPKANILDYELVQNMEVADFGKPISPFEIYENGILIESISFTGNTLNNRLSLYPKGTIVYEDENIKVISGELSWEVTLKEPLELSVKQEGWFISGEAKPKKMIIDINSNLKSDIQRNLYVGFYRKIPFTGEEEFVLFDEKKNVIITPGENSYDFIIPEEIEAGDYKFFAFVAESMSKCWIPSCSQHTAGLITPYVTKDFIVATKPLWKIVNPTELCPIGYEKQREDTLCLLSEYSDSPCLSLGCPPHYSCTLGGCTEVLVSIDCLNQTDCGPNEVCNLEIGLCMNKIIYDKLYGCTNTDQCTKPCFGKIAKCENNVCKYTGGCTDPIKPCYEKDPECSEGYVCLDTGFCKETFISGLKVWAKENIGLMVTVSILLLSIIGIFTYLAYDKWFRK